MARLTCQIDFLIQTKFKTLYVIEIKFSKEHIQGNIIGEVKNKIKRITEPNLGLHVDNFFLPDSIIRARLIESKEAHSQHRLQPPDDDDDIYFPREVMLACTAFDPGMRPSPRAAIEMLVAELERSKPSRKTEYPGLLMSQQFLSAALFI